MWGEDLDRAVHKGPTEDVTFQVAAKNVKAPTTQEGGNVLV